MFRFSQWYFANFLGEGARTKVDYREKGQASSTSLLENPVVVAVGGSWVCSLGDLAGVFGLGGAAAEAFAFGRQGQIRACTWASRTRKACPRREKTRKEGHSDRHV